MSYADFITLLFAFFVVMYAISSLNEGKYRVLSDTLTAAFNQTPKSLQPIQIGDEGVNSEPMPIAVKEKAGSKPTAAGDPKPTTTMDILQRSARDNSLGEIANDFREAMASLVDKDLININQDDLWVEVEINNSILFPSASSELEPKAIPVLQQLAGLLKRYPNYIQVEGFTDNVPINTHVFPSNWELSAARAASVVHVFMNSGVEPGRMAAIGYGEYRPVADNATDQGRRRNRRVVLVILADDKARRALDLQRNERSLR